MGSLVHWPRPRHTADNGQNEQTKTLTREREKMLLGMLGGYKLKAEKDPEMH